MMNHADRSISLNFFVIVRLNSEVPIIFNVRVLIRDHSKKKQKSYPYSFHKLVVYEDVQYFVRSDSSKYSYTEWITSTWTTLIADCDKALRRRCLLLYSQYIRVQFRAQFSPEYGSKNRISKFIQTRNLLVPKKKWRFWTTQGLQKSTLPSYCWDLNTLLEKGNTFSCSLEKQNGQAWK